MFVIDKEKCIGCGQCVRDCFAFDIRMIEKKAKIMNRKCFKCGHCIAVCPVNAVETTDYDMNDIKEYNSEEFKVDSDKFLNFIKFRRTVRHFINKGIESDKLEKILESGRYSPTASNSQNVSFTVVTQELKKIKNLALESLKKKGEEILQSDDKKSGNEVYKWYANLWIKMYDDNINKPESRDLLTFNSPVIIFIKSSSAVNGSIAACSMEYMTNSLGLGSVYSGFLTIAANRSAELKDILDIKEGEEVVTALVIGYPDIKYMRTVPREKSQIKWL